MRLKWKTRWEVVYKSSIVILKMCVYVCLCYADAKNKGETAETKGCINYNLMAKSQCDKCNKILIIK